MFTPKTKTFSRDTSTVWRYREESENFYMIFEKYIGQELCKMIYRCGEFSWDTEEEILSGPRVYMEEQGDQLLNDILDGNDPVFNTMLLHGYNEMETEQSILNRLQTDYAGWKGKRTLF